MFMEIINISRKRVPIRYRLRRCVSNLNISVVELKTEACTRENDPGCDHICVVNPIYGPLCACHFGYVVSSILCLKTCQIFTVPLECAEQSPIKLE